MLYEQKKLILYPQGKTDTEFSVPDGTVIIGENAIQNKYLQKINLPDSLVSIESFGIDCDNLESLVLPGSLARIGDDALGYHSIYDNVSLTVPSGSYHTGKCNQYII